MPKFECSFAPTLVECQRQIQAYLDAWYADFNVIFTLTRPTSGKYYTEVVSSGGGAWCKVDDKVAGVAPFLCKDLQGGVAYTFQGGRSARETAVIIAQEQAHLLGLEHTTNPHDIMFPTISTDTTASSTTTAAVTGDRCDRATQNSYQMMKKALGAWPGGPKPSAFGCIEDTQDADRALPVARPRRRQGPRLLGEGRRARRLRRQEGRDQGHAAGAVGGGDGARPTSGI